MWLDGGQWTYIEDSIYTTKLLHAHEEEAEEKREAVLGFNEVEDLFGDLLVLDLGQEVAPEWCIAAFSFWGEEHNQVSSRKKLTLATFFSSFSSS